MLLVRGTVAEGFTTRPGQSVGRKTHKLYINIKIIKKMANHKSSLKRIRQDKKKAEHNHYYAKTMRNAVRKLRAMTNKEEAAALYPKVQKMLDKLAKTNIIHKNKAANLKSSLAQHISKLG